MPSSSGEVAGSTDLAAPCSGVLSRTPGSVPTRAGEAAGLAQATWQSRRRSGRDVVAVLEPRGRQADRRILFLELRSVAWWSGGRAVLLSAGWLCVGVSRAL